MKYILKWLFLFLGITLLIFSIVRIMPFSPVEMLLQQYNLPFTEENKKMLIEQFGLNVNIFTQYIKWLINFLKGDFGQSFLTKMPIRDEMLRKLPYSFFIGFSSLLLAIVLSFILGYLSAIKENSLFDIFTRGLSIFNLTIPSFLWAILIIYYFGVKIKAIKFFTDGSFWGIVFSILILTLYQLGSLSRIVRQAFVRLKEESYVKFYVLRGFKMEYILLRHCYKPVLYSLFSASISRFSSVIGGSTVLEFAFAIPGISYFLINSIIARDYNVIQAYILFVFIWMFLVHLFFDFCLIFLKEKR
ncbi:MAG: ABC transporter permease [Fusobacterium sp.]|uniref:ABC transporter permease n=1 Tax=Fusobacterium sp. TaxID=68766 RepID=UPI0026DC2328|nr:ABC transporter permease [Fusobacterium sp.]MDO4690301.1 ABC transporter permease [Fusobacterium sp.]